MTFNLKEKFEQFDQKNLNTLLIAVIAIVFLFFSAFQAVQIHQLKQAVKATTDQVEKEEPADNNTALDENPSKKPSEYNVGMDYGKAIKAKKPILLLFYADWCGYCIRFMPVYEKLSKVYRRELNFVKINVEDPQYKEVVDSYKISGFPSVFFVDPRIDDRRVISNNLLFNMDTVTPELDKYIKISKKLNSKF